MRKRNIFWLIFVAVFLFCCVFLLKALEEDNTIQLVWVTPFEVSSHKTDLLNRELLQQGINVRLSFKYIGNETYIEETSELLANGNVDIVNAGIFNWRDLGNRFAFTNNLAELDVLLETDSGQALYQAYPESFWHDVKINNHNYWIYQGGNVPVVPGVIINQELANLCNIDIDTISYDNLTDLALQAQSICKSNGYFTISNAALLMRGIPDATFVCSPFIPLYIEESSENWDVKCLFDNEQFQATYTNLQKLSQLSAISTSPSDIALFELFNYTTPEDFCAIFGQDLSNNSVVLLFEPVNYPTELLGQYVGISKNSHNIDLAFEVLSKIYSDPTLTNILIYGEEGVDYQLSNGVAVSVNTSKFVNPSYGHGNLFIAHPHLFQDPDMQVNYRERIDTMKKSRIAGFIFDGSSLQAEITKTTDIMTTFYMALGNRSEAYDLPLADILSQLNDAGLQKIQEEVSNQLLHFGCS